MAYIASDYVGGIGVHDPDILAPLFAGGGTATLPFSKIDTPEGLPREAAQLGQILYDLQSAIDVNNALYKTTQDGRYYNKVVELQREYITYDAWRKGLLANYDDYKKESEKLSVDMDSRYITPGYKTSNLYSLVMEGNNNLTFGNAMRGKLNKNLKDGNGDFSRYEMFPITNFDNKDNYDFVLDILKYLGHTEVSGSNTFSVDSQGNVLKSKVDVGGKTVYEFTKKTNANNLTALYKNVGIVFDGLKDPQKQSLLVSAMNTLFDNLNKTKTEINGKDYYNVEFGVDLLPEGRQDGNTVVYNMKLGVGLNPDGKSYKRMIDAERVLSFDKDNNPVYTHYKIENGKRVKLKDSELKHLYLSRKGLISNDAKGVGDKGKQWLLSAFLRADKDFEREFLTLIDAYGDNSLSEEERKKVGYNINHKLATLMLAAGEMRPDQINKEFLEEQKPEAMFKRFAEIGEGYLKTALNNIIQNTVYANVGVWSIKSDSHKNDLTFYQGEETGTDDNIFDALASISDYDDYDILYNGDRNVFEGKIHVTSVNAEDRNKAFGKDIQQWNNVVTDLVRKQNEALNSNIREVKKENVTANVLGQDVDMNLSVTTPLRDMAHGHGVVAIVPLADSRLMSFAIKPDANVGITMFTNNMFLGAELTDDRSMYALDKYSKITENSFDDDVIAAHAAYNMVFGVTTIREAFKWNIVVSKDDLLSVGKGTIRYQDGAIDIPFEDLDLTKDKEFKDAYIGAIRSYNAMMELGEDKVRDAIESVRNSSPDYKNYSDAKLLLIYRNQAPLYEKDEQMKKFRKDLYEASTGYVRFLHTTAHNYFRYKMDELSDLEKRVVARAKKYKSEVSSTQGERGNVVWSGRPSEIKSIVKEAEGKLNEILQEEYDIRFKRMSEELGKILGDLNYNEEEKTYTISIGALCQHSPKKYKKIFGMQTFDDKGDWKIQSDTYVSLDSRIVLSFGLRLNENNWTPETKASKAKATNNALKREGANKSGVSYVTQ